MGRAACLALAVMMLAGCIDRVAHETSALTLSVAAVDQRRVQGRVFETANEAILLRETALVLRKLGFRLSDTPDSLGILSGWQDMLMFDRHPTADTEIVSGLFGLPGTFTNTIKVQVTVSATPTTDGRDIMLRTSFQKLVWTSLTQSSHLVTVADPDIYQNFYRDLAQSSQIQAHQL